MIWELSRTSYIASDFAIQTKNSADLKRIKVLLDRSAQVPAEDDGDPIAVDENVQAAQLCASLAEPTLIVEQLLQDPSGERLSSVPATLYTHAYVCDH